MSLNRKLRMGMVGGGPGSFIGAVHLKAARMDGGIDLVAGAFSSDPQKSQADRRPSNALTRSASTAVIKRWSKK